MNTPLPNISITSRAWLADAVDREWPYGSNDDRVRPAVSPVHENFARRTGGPCRAVVSESDTGRVVDVGVKLPVIARYRPVSGPIHNG